jgi:hypothetical protein
MLTRVLPVALLFVVLLGSQANAYAQASPAQGGQTLPPPVSVDSYRVETGIEQRSNYIRGSILAGVGYIDNLYPGGLGQLGQLGETIISLQPTIAFETESARAHTSVLYSPNFIFYEPTSAVNEADHSALFGFRYRFSPRLTLDVNDNLLKSSTGFGQIGNGGISGSAQTTTPGVIVPYGDRFSNDASGGLSYQFGPHGAIGGSGNVGYLNYPNTSQLPDLYSSDSRGGGGFYSYRLSESQYLGATYQYEQVFAYPTGSGEYETQTHTIDGFYTIYLTNSFSLSVAGGPQEYIASHAPLPTTSAWTPSVTASMGWRNNHTSFAANFSRTVTGGGGLLGAFNSKSTGASGLWQVSRLWSGGLNVNYAINKDATPLFGLNNQGGHALTTSLTAGRILSDHARAGLTYDRIQSRYDGIQSITANPTSDRVMVSITWEFLRPVGR